MRRRGCEEGCLKLVQRCAAALEHNLDRVKLRLQEALLETGRVGHLKQALLEPRFVSGDLRRKRIELARQLAC